MRLDTSFCMDSGQVKTGEDADDTYIKMLQEVKMITVSMAHGIAGKYPNVSSLLSGFKQLGPLALEDVRVRLVDLPAQSPHLRTLISLMADNVCNRLEISEQGRRHLRQEDWTGC